MCFFTFNVERNFDAFARIFLSSISVTSVLRSKDKKTPAKHAKKHIIHGIPK